MAVTTPRVRDFTTAERSLNVEVASGDAFEVLLSLYALGGDEDEADLEIGAEWFEGIRERAGHELLSRLSLLGDWSVWVALVGEVFALGAPYTAERLLEHLGRIDPIRLRSLLLEVGSCYASEPLSPEDLQAVAEGDAALIAKAEAFCEKCPGLIELVKLSPEETRESLVGMLRDFVAADPLPAGTVGVLEQDAEHKRSLARRMDPVKLVEKATNGITVAVRPGLKGVVLVPTVVLRPWAIIVENAGKQIFCYSVPEESLGLVDPDAPPGWLVQFYKALGDERRLTILRRLAEGPASFGELVELLDLAKSTVHHHIRQLRTAGVVRVTVGDEKEYSLRTGTVPEAARLLEGFLGTTTNEDD